MKRHFPNLALIGLLTTVAVPAAAIDLNMYGAWLDTEDTDASAGGGLKADFFLGETPWAMELSATWFPELGTDRRDIIEGEVGPLLDIDLFPIDIGFNYHFLEDQNLFAGGGFTYALLESNIHNIDNEWGWYVDLGFKTNSRGGHWGFFIEGTYRWIEGKVLNAGDPDEIELVRFNVDLNSYGVNAGATYRF